MARKLVAALVAAAALYAVVPELSAATALNRKMAVMVDVKEKPAPYAPGKRPYCAVTYDGGSYAPDFKGRLGMSTDSMPGFFL
jgi:hypothetical protein